MKYFIIFSLFINSIALGQINQKQVEVISISKESFIKNLSEKEFHLIYTTAYWCAPCLETFPLLKKIIENNTNIIDLYPTFNERDNKKIRKSIEFMGKYNWQGDIYNIDTKYGNKFKRRYHNFVQHLAPKHSEYGLSLFLLFNKKGELLYSSNFNETKEVRLNEIKRFLKYKKNDIP